VFEITPKEQLLKNIRKGLVQPLPNKYPLLNFEKDILKKSLLLHDESFIKSWVDHGFYFSTYKGIYDLVHQISELQNTHALGVLAIEEKYLTDLFTEHSLPFLPAGKADKSVLCSLSKLENTSDGICFSSELHPLRQMKHENLILFGRSSQIESPWNNRFFSELTQKNDLRVQLHIDFFKQFKSVFLFIEEDK
jgi:hypothetical protein